MTCPPSRMMRVKVTCARLNGLSTATTTLKIAVASAARPGFSLVPPMTHSAFWPTTLPASSKRKTAARADWTALVHEFFMVNLTMALLPAGVGSSTFTDNEAWVVARVENRMKAQMIWFGFIREGGSRQDDRMTKWIAPGQGTRLTCRPPAPRRRCVRLMVIWCMQFDKRDIQFLQLAGRGGAWGIHLTGPVGVSRTPFHSPFLRPARLPRVMHCTKD